VAVLEYSIKYSYTNYSIVAALIAAFRYYMYVQVDAVRTAVSRHHR